MGVRTVILLPKDLRQCDSVLDACFPCITLESKKRLFAIFCDRGQLEEIASDDELRGIIVICRYNWKFTEPTWRPPNGLSVFFRSRAAISHIFSNKCPSTIDTVINKQNN